MSDIIVSKFGGSSLATAEKIKNITKIVNDDNRRRVVVVSAPGKKDSKDTKVTDMLIDLAETRDYSIINKIIERYCNIFCPLGIEKQEIGTLIKETLEKRLNAGLIEEAIMDSVKAFGEEVNARLIAKVNRWEYIDPRGYIMVSNDFGNAKVHDETYKRLKKLNLEFFVSVIPGFYGYTRDKVLPIIATFSRGGSDLTGAVIAAGLDAILYENFTDKDGVLAANPNIIPNAKLIKEMTYREIRNLSYVSYQILHKDAMRPTELKGIPIHIRNTEKYPLKGTKIVSDRIYDPKKPIVGVAYDDIYSFNTENFGLNEQKGMVKGILGILEEKYDINIEFFPGAIDKQLFVFRKNKYDLNGVTITNIKKELKELIGQHSKIKFRQDSGVLVIAGEGIGESYVGYDIAKILKKQDIKKDFFIEDKGCCIIEVKREKAEKAVKLAYNFIK